MTPTAPRPNRLLLARGDSRNRRLLGEADLPTRAGGSSLLAISDPIETDAVPLDRLDSQ